MPYYGSLGRSRSLSHPEVFNRAANDAAISIFHNRHARRPRRVSCPHVNAEALDSPYNEPFPPVLFRFDSADYFMEKAGHPDIISSSKLNDISKRAEEEAKNMNETRPRRVQNKNEPLSPQRASTLMAEGTGHGFPTPEGKEVLRRAADLEKLHLSSSPSRAPMVVSSLASPSSTSSQGMAGSPCSISRVSPERSATSHPYRRPPRPSRDVFLDPLTHEKYSASERVMEKKKNALPRGQSMNNLSFVMAPEGSPKLSPSFQAEIQTRLEQEVDKNAMVTDREHTLESNMFDYI